MNFQLFFMLTETRMIQQKWADQKYGDRENENNVLSKSPHFLIVF